MNDAVFAAGVGNRADRGVERSLCHDLKTPLAAVLVIASDTAALPPDEFAKVARSRLRQIEGQAELLADLIDATLGPAPAAGDASEPAADLDATLAVAVAMARLTSPGDVDLAAGAADVKVPTSRAQLHRVVSNVLANAVRAAGPAGSVRVSSRVADGRAVVDIDDDGPGWGQIPAGHGLGLAYVHDVLDAVGGSVSACRSTSGRTRVRLDLPRQH